MRDVAQVALEERDQTELEGRLEAARARHARHYCGLLETATDLYLSGGEGVSAGLALYDLEQRNTAAGQAWAAARIEQDDAAAARLAADYANAGCYVPSACTRWRGSTGWRRSARAASASATGGTRATRLAIWAMPGRTSASRGGRSSSTSSTA
jgi:hypothetical protein